MSINNPTPEERLNSERAANGMRPVEPMVAVEYIRKPLPIEAVLVTDKNIEWVANWCGGKIEETQALSDGDFHISVLIPTLNGVESISGDGSMYLVKSPNGRFSRMLKSVIESEYQINKSVRDIPTKHKSETRIY